MRVNSVSEMRTLDGMATEEFGIAAELLMENAGQAVYFTLLKEFGIEGKRFVVFCGLGNNGGDGFVVARKIHSSGGAVKVFVLGDPSRFQGAARTNLDIVSRLPIEVRQIGRAEKVRAEVAHCDCIVDAILGTGLIRNVTGLYRNVIELINGSGKTVFSVDIPSGVHGDTGKVMGTAVRADYTVTFGLPKLGNLLFPGYELGGKLYVSHISFPPSIYDTDSLKVEINQPVKLPPRDQDAHKGDFGKALFIAGAAGYLGAPYFAAHSFLKAGGGYSRLAAPKSITPFIATKGSEIWSVAPATLVYDAIQIMTDRRVGALLVMSSERLVGVLSERDYLRRVILQHRTSKSTHVGDIMTSDPVTVSPDQSIQECMQLMTEKRIRHLPVVDRQRVVGLISIGDVVKKSLAYQQYLLDELERYVAG